LAFAYPGGELKAFRAGLQLRAGFYDDEGAKRKCRELGIKVSKSQAEGINSAGGFLVNDELEREILSLRDNAGVFRRYSRTITLGTDSRRWPRRTAGLTAAFFAENTAAGESTAKFDEIRFNVKKAGALVRLSSEISEDETVGLAAWVAEEMAWGFADLEDSCGFTGDGTSTYYGMRGLTVLAVDGQHNASKFTAANSTFATLTAADIAGFVGTLPAYAVPGAAIYISHAGFSNTFIRLGQSSGALTSTTTDGVVQFAYLGFPVRLTPKLPSILTTLTGKAMMFCGDLALASAIGTRRGVTVRSSDQRYLENDQIAIRGTERIDVVTHDFGDNTNAGPLVSLVAA
jgi:HK97 family phage major capsid protein